MSGFTSIGKSPNAGAAQLAAFLLVGSWSCYDIDTPQDNFALVASHKEGLNVIGWRLEFNRPG